jgi:hypothetical protein
MNPLAILFQAALPSIPVFFLFVPVVSYVLWRQVKPYPKYFWGTIFCAVGMPLVAAVMGYALYDSRSDLTFAILQCLIILDAVIFAGALIAFKGLRLLVASIAIPTLWFLFFTTFAAGLSIFNTWL